MLLFYGHAATWIEADQAETLRAALDADTFPDGGAREAEGAVLLLAGLHTPSMRVRVRDGKLEATESSISETSVQPRFLAIVEVVDIGDAVALVERLPKVDLSAVEIRPLLPLPEPLSLPVGDANEAGASKAIAHEDFLVLLHAAAGAWPPEEHAVALAESVELCHRLYERGQFVSAAPLKPPETAVTVARRGARATVTD